MRKVAGRWGDCYYFGKDEYVGRSVHNYGEYNPDETEFILELAREAITDNPNALILDIGANIGCIAQALEFNKYNVVAWEPQPEVFSLLQKNFHGRAFNCALGSSSGIGKMPKLRYDDKNNVGGASIGTRSILGTIDVPIEMLDSYGFKDVGLMKIDVEGFELEVLKGSTELINRDHPILYIEDDRIEKSKDLHEYLHKLGYTWEVHEPPLYRPDNFFGLKKNIWSKNYVSKNIVCRWKE